MLADRVTLADLGITPGGGDPDVLSWHDATWSAGGRRKARELMLQPLDSVQTIHDRQHTLRTLGHLTPHIARRDVGAIAERTERYLASTLIPLPPGRVSNWLVRKRYRAAASEIDRGLDSTQRLLLVALDLADAVRDLARESEEISGIEQRLRACLDFPPVRALVHLASRRAFLRPTRVRLDRAIRLEGRAKLTELLAAMFHLDALVSLAQLANRPGFTYPEVVESAEPLFDARGLFHPLLEHPVANDVAIGAGARLLFLTGPNMAGKTTLMRSCGLALLLAHVGTAVPASSLRFSVFDRLFASLAVRDSIVRGESFFLAEARRVGMLVGHLAAGERVFALMDEMFKGTNVLDAHDATELVVANISRARTSAFLVASHLVELAERLREVPAIRFQQMEVEQTTDGVRFTFVVKDGVSHQRLGMFLLEREGIAGALRRLEG